MCGAARYGEKKSQMAAPVTEEKHQNPYRSQLGWLANAFSICAASCIILLRGLLKADLLREDRLVLKKCILAGERGFRCFATQSQEWSSQYFFAGAEGSTMK